MLIDKLANMCYNNNSKRDKAKTKYIISLILIITKRGEKVNRKIIVLLAMTVKQNRFTEKICIKESLNRE